MTNRFRRRRVGVGFGFVLTSLLWLLCTGCTKTTTHQLARYEPTYNATPEPTTQPVPVVAVYQVKVYGRDGRLHGIDGTERLLHKGDVVGFRTDHAGVVQAMADRDVFPLPPMQGRKVVWVGQSICQTPFGREAEKAMNAGSNVLVGAGEIVVVGGLVVLEGIVGQGDTAQKWAERVSSHQHRDSKRQRRE